MCLLQEKFNQATVAQLMCRDLISVGWDGYLYDCDFNQMLEMKLDKPAGNHIRDFNKENLMQRNIKVGQHCYACTAGAGSSCSGAIV